MKYYMSRRRGPHTFQFTGCFFFMLLPNFTNDTVDSFGFHGTLQYFLFLQIDSSVSTYWEVVVLEKPLVVP